METWILIISLLSTYNLTFHNPIATFANELSCKELIPVYKELLSAMDRPPNFKAARLSCHTYSENADETIKTSNPPYGTPKKEVRPQAGCRQRQCLG